MTSGQTSLPALAMRLFFATRHRVRRMHSRRVHPGLQGSLAALRCGATLIALGADVAVVFVRRLAAFGPECRLVALPRCLDAQQF